MAKEIERKFLISLGDLPSDLRIIDNRYITQTYLAVGDQEVRIRRTSTFNLDLETKQTMTVKTGSGLVREEIEIPIEESTYAQLLEVASQHKELQKNRVSVDWNGVILMVDVFISFEFSIIELEFDTEDEAIEFIPPEWFGKEITYDKEYKNQSLWLKIQ